MTMPIDPETAKRLLDAGQINPATYDSYVGNANVQKPAAPTGPVFGDTRGTGLSEQDMAVANDFLKQKNQEDFVRKRDIAKAAGIDEAEMKNADWWSSDFDDEANLELNNPGLKPSDFTGQPPSVGDEVDLAQGELVADQNQNLGGGVGYYGSMDGGQMGLYPTPGLDLQQQAVAQQAAVGNAKGLEQAAQYDTMQKELALMERADEQQRIGDQEEIDKAAAKFSSEVERVSALKVDPDKFWGDRSTGQKVLAGIGLFLGALGSANNGVNRAVQVLDNAIERDIKTQQANLAQENVGIAQKRGILGDMKRAFKDDRMAYLATKNAYLQRAQIEIQKIQSQFQGPEMAARAEQWIGQIESQKQAIQREAMARASANLPADKKVAPKDPKLLERWIPDYGYVNQQAQVKPAIELISNMKDLKGNLEDLIKIGKMSTAERAINPAQIRKDANLAQGMLVGALNKKITGGGPLSESELALVKSIVPDTSAVFRLTGSDVKVLEKLVSKIDTNGWDKLRLYGLKNPLDKYDVQDVK